MQLSIAANPLRICPLTAPGCDAGTTTSRVTLDAVAPNSPTQWPAVQIVFAIDGTFFNGVYTPTDDAGYNLCDRTGNMIPCEESNGLPVFVANAGSIAQTLQAENPHSQVTFGLVDFESTLCDYGDCDGNVYRVDVGQFVSAATFGDAVSSSFQANYLGGGYSCYDCDFWDNFLHAPSITALYGVLSGAGVDSSPSAHHVVIWIGDSAPRDPTYPENYCVSGWDGGVIDNSCYSKTCEPGYSFPQQVMPPCEGWVRPQDGNPLDSIAALARTSPDCVHSLGGSCVIDMIDLWSANTDPYSVDWPAQFKSQGGGPGGFVVQQNVNNILLAGCDMARATGGSWDGPAWFACPGGGTGTLQYETHGPRQNPNLANPSLLAAIRTASFGPAPNLPAAAGTNRPIFEYVPFGAIRPDQDLNATASCLHLGAPMRTCQTNPTVTDLNGVPVLGWNWSTNASQNVLYSGDTWEAQFNVVATGPPYAVVPVDACTTVACSLAGSGAVSGALTSATYTAPPSTSVVTQSFPLAEVSVVPPPVNPNPPPGLPPAPPPPLLPIPVGIGSQLPVGQPLALPNVSLLSGLSLNVAAAGFLAAGFTRVVLKNKPIAMSMAMKSGLLSAKKRAEDSPPDPRLEGRWE
ncbi:MAG TPA: hypothetical protein VEY07_08735 [Thermoplasmata archaeon]|nr:hypothetical protein [Thermoplasmata archaeon]